MNPNNLDLENGDEISCCNKYVYLSVTFNYTGMDKRKIEKQIV